MALKILVSKQKNIPTLLRVFYFLNFYFIRYFSPRLTLLQSAVWSGDFLLITWSDRAQREATLQVCDVTTRDCREDVATVGPNNRNGWIHDLVKICFYVVSEI